ncbi:hypothetical protein ACOZ4N_00585 (plasmid) [Halorientalis pallida]|uniref:hypothetical protein n=1 Tax=Halorientalis pallida TaxID=2479928 RepID=UPI003C6F79FC
MEEFSMTEAPDKTRVSPANQFDPAWPQDIDDLDDVPVRDECQTDTGPDATPPVEAEAKYGWSLDEAFCDDTAVTVVVTQGTRELVTLDIVPVEYETPTWTVRTDPPLKCFTDEIQTAVVEALSLSMQPLVEIVSLES